MQSIISAQLSVRSCLPQGMEQLLLLKVRSFAILVFDFNILDLVMCFILQIS